MALLLIIGVLVGAKVVAERAGNQPIGMSPLPAPMAESQECTTLIDTLPDELVGHDRAEIVEPVPPGTAAWASSSLEEVTLRCGIELPLQYTEYSQPVDVDGTQWLVVGDATPESTLQTWYSVNTSPVVAVTADEQTLGRHDNPVAGISEQMAELPRANHEPRPAPLSQLEPAPVDTAEICAPLMENLPSTLADSWQRTDNDGADTAVWTLPGQEPIVVRCGVAPPENYAAGERLTQVNDVPWFEDPELANGSTAGTWYALGRATDIAVSMPQAAASAALVELSDAITAHTPEQEPAS